MRVALISDLHGNLLALEATLTAIQRHAVDQVVCLGDTATLGPRPREVLARLRQLGCVCICGNHDAFLLDAELIHTYSEVPIIMDAVNWCREQMTAEDLEYVRSFVDSHELVFPTGARALLFHGTPRSNMEDLLATTDATTLDAMLGAAIPSEAMSRAATAGNRGFEVMACGHTHIQMLRQHRGTWIVNPGSVGMPFKEYVSGREPVILPYAEWACIEVTETDLSVSLHRVPLDARALRDQVLHSSNPLAPSLIAAYERFC
jgi:predicted phosphodiesterase